jgi:hypothetical protein
MRSITMLRISLWLFCLAILAPGTHAADTLEVWDAGSGNFEMYSGFGGLGAATADQSIGSSMLLGWGVARRFSAYVGTALAADGNFDQTETELNLGAFGTVLDSDHLDLDVGLDMVAYGPGMTDMAVVPAFELNLDRAPDLAAFGSYLRGAARIAGRDIGGREIRRHVDFNLTFGSYLTVSPTRQLVLEYDLTFHDHPEPGTPDIEKGCLALGYNVLLSDRLELISEARLDIPQGDETTDLGLMLGVITALE